MSDKIEFSGLGERFRGVPLLGGLLGGVLSFVAGYLAFLGIAAGTGDGIEFNARSLRQVGQFFYNSLLVPTHQRTKQVIENEAQGETVLQETVFNVRYNPFYESDTVDVDTRTYLDGNLYNEESRSIATETATGFTLPDLTFPDFVYLAIPVVILLAVGFLFAYRFVSLEGIQSWDDVLTRGLISGGTITLGFLLLILVGAYLFVIDGIAIFTAQSADGAFTRPDRLDALLFGLAYPAVCSSVGALLGLVARQPTIEETGHAEPTDLADETADDAGSTDEGPEPTAEQPSSSDGDTESADESPDSTDVSVSADDA